MFSMFFGSGNLMFPLSLGVSAQGDLFYGALGFILAAVLLPLFGVLVMVLYEGDADRFFSFLPSKAAFGFIALLLTIWIPLGSGPRCIALAYSSFGASISLPPLWI
ncbi:MAG: branched-chain amino acid transport system II carrier protein [Chlamydiia bacterium]|nr:branched-chain amino acid transport system II carrier protein [Chlamydiia bacterium]